MKTRSILASLICVAALGAVTLSALAGDKPGAQAQSNENLPGEWPKLVSSVQPKYPAKLLAEKVEGTVSLAFIVNSRGEVIEVTAVSSDHPEFEAAAIEAVKQWKYTPGLKGGRPVSTRMTQPIRFELPKNEKS